MYKDQQHQIEQDRAPLICVDGLEEENIGGAKTNTIQGDTYC